MKLIIDSIAIRKLLLKNPMFKIRININQKNLQMIQITLLQFQWLVEKLDMIFNQLREYLFKIDKTKIKSLSPPLRTKNIKKHIPGVQKETLLSEVISFFFRSVFLGHPVVRNNILWKYGIYK